jgi:hypothetical protein
MSKITDYFTGDPTPQIVINYLSKNDVDIIKTINGVYLADADICEKNRTPGAYNIDGVIELNTFMKLSAVTIYISHITAIEKIRR